MGVLQGKAVVVTGSGRGMGETHARLAAKEGARVVINDVDRSEAERVAAAIRAEGGTAEVCVADIASWDSAESLVRFCVSRFGALDGFVNNAALFHMALASEETEARLRRAVEVNVLGTAFCGLAALRQMSKQGRGSLVNITSGAHSGAKGMSTYGATKGAVASLTYSWAIDVQDTGVRVNAVSPMAQTRMIDTATEYYRDHGGVAPDIAIPPENNSPLVVYLLSDLASKVNGQIVRVMGPSISLVTHPASLHPGVDCADWTVAEVAKAFDTRLAAQQLPLGVQAYEVKVREYGLPYDSGTK